MNDPYCINQSSELFPKKTTSPHSILLPELNYHNDRDENHRGYYLAFCLGFEKLTVSWQTNYFSKTLLLLFERVTGMYLFWYQNARYHVRWIRRAASHSVRTKESGSYHECRVWIELICSELRSDSRYHSFGIEIYSSRPSPPSRHRSSRSPLFQRSRMRFWPRIVGVNPASWSTIV